MIPPIVSSSAPVTLLGGGQATPQDLAEALTIAPLLVAADGGARLALEIGHRPHAVIGDMDSFPPEWTARIPPDSFHRISEQNSTDFDKALRSIDAPLILGVGFLGGRVDHELACLNTLVRRCNISCLLIGAEDVLFALPAKRWLDLELRPGSRVSLFPLAQVTGRSEGLDWPIDGLALAPDGQIGTSNRTTSGQVRLWADGPGLVVILPRHAMAQARAGLRAVHAI